MASVDAALEAPHGWRLWWLAARPRTLSVGIAPVLVGAALAFAHGRARALPALAALAGALLLQIGANLANDLFDAEKGADTQDRIGPTRVTQMGWISPTRMRVGTAVAFGAAGAVGLYLVAVGGWPIAVLGALAIVAGLAYTGGPYPLGYHGLGDLAVFGFFGIAAVCGTYYVQALLLPPVVLLAALPLGALATAVLVVNNVRDVEGDRRAGKRTLVVRWGRRGGQLEYAGLMLLCYALPVALWLAGAASAWILLPLATAPLAVGLAHTVFTREEGAALNAALAGTARLELAYALLFSVGWVA